MLHQSFAPYQWFLCSPYRFPVFLYGPEKGMYQIIVSFILLTFIFNRGVNYGEKKVLSVFQV